MEKTAMQEALEHLYKNADYLSGPNDCSSDRSTGQYLRLMAEEIEEKYLPKERQQIEDAIISQNIDVNDGIAQKIASDYYKEKFIK